MYTMMYGYSRKWYRSQEDQEINQGRHAWRMTFSVPSRTEHLYLRHYKSRTAPLDMHHLTFGINSLLHSVDLIVFTLLLAHLILRISSHHSHHLRSHHLSLPPPFTPDLKLISFTNPFLHSHSYSFRTDFTDPGASTPYKRRSKCSMKKVRGEGFCSLFREIKGGS